MQVCTCVRTDACTHARTHARTHILHYRYRFSRSHQLAESEVHQMFGSWLLSTSVNKDQSWNQVRHTDLIISHSYFLHAYSTHITYYRYVYAYICITYDICSSVPTYICTYIQYTYACIHAYTYTVHTYIRTRKLCHKWNTSSTHSPKGRITCTYTQTSISPHFCYLCFFFCHLFQ